MRKLSFLFISLVVIFFNSCSLQKRSYRPGYYIAWKNSPHDTKPEKQAFAAVRITKQITPVEAHAASHPKPGTPLLTPTRFKPILKQDPDNCDTLVLRNGTEIKVKVLEINPEEVKYKYCNNPNGPLIIVAKSDVQMIKYANGQKDEFAEKKTPSYNNRQMLGEMNVHRDAQSSLILGIVSFIIVYFGIITAIFAITRGRRALRMIGTDPMMQMRYYKQARAGVILGTVYLSLIGVLLALALFAAFI